MRLTRSAVRRVEPAAIWALLASVRPLVLRLLIAAPRQERIEETK